MANSLSLRRGRIVELAFGFVLLLSGGLRAQSTPELNRLAAEFQVEANVPAVFMAFGSAGQRPALAAAGVRKMGDPTPVTADDKIHLGSCTKAATAVLIARLVEQGHLNWTDTIELRMPEVAGRIPESHRQVTLEQLLQHRSGFPANARNWWMYKGATISEFRIEILVDTLNHLELKPPGQQQLYSNLGYMAAGLMAEHATGMTWEALMQRLVFQPLGLESAGFGPPSTLNSLAQPWGHTPKANQGHHPVQGDNAPALGPAGTVHMSMADWFKFCSLFAGEMPPDFLNADSLKKLLTPDLNKEYAYGWGLSHRQPWAQGIAYSHSGSNTMWFCTAWVAPQTKKVYLVAFNLGGDAMGKVANDAILKLIALDSR